jgi:Domain of unknown function (DUF4440)
MRKMSLCVLFATALLAIGCAGAPPRSVFIQLENDWVAALRTHDAAALDRLLDDSFVDTTFRGGRRTKHDVLIGPPAGGVYHTLRLDDVAVRIYSNRTAVVTGVNVLQGPKAEDVVRVSFTDVFIRRHGAWRAISAQETLQEAQHDASRRE